MPSLFQNLIEAAERISEQLEAKQHRLEAEYAEAEAHLAKLKRGLAVARIAPERKGHLFGLYSVSERQLCPDCYLNRSLETELERRTGTKDADRFACPVCGFEVEHEF